jgi:hypothetical protein
MDAHISCSPSYRAIWAHTSYRAIRKRGGCSSGRTFRQAQGAPWGLSGMSRIGRPCWRRWRTSTAPGNAGVPDVLLLRTLATLPFAEAASRSGAAGALFRELAILLRLG